MGAAGSAVLATASSAEEKTGAVMKQAGETLEKDGATARRYYRGDQAKHEVKDEARKKGICTIM